MADDLERTNPPSVEPSSPAGVCIVCQCPIDASESTTVCPGCGASYHTECWTYNGGCGVYGCSQAAATERLTALEIPASHWGREEKECPQCAETILAAARRCVYCGAIFSSTAPQGSAEFSKQQRTKAALPSIKKWAIALLVLALIPCTAPFTAVGGAIWLAINWKPIQSMPPAIGAIGKIAVGIAWLQTFLLIGAAVLNSTLNR